MSCLGLPEFDEEQPRLRSESPEGVTPGCVLEWNFFASRVNAVVAMMRAHQQFQVPLNMAKLANGMTLERVRAFTDLERNLSSRNFRPKVRS